jgi:hypothetical protein
VSLVTIGVRPGTRREPAALAVVEAEEREDGERRAHHFLVRHLARLPAGTPYPALALRLGEVVAAAQARAGDDPEIYADVTGAGQPVADLLSARSRGVPVRPVFFSHGDRRTEEAGAVRLGKAWLVARLQTLLQARQLHLPRTAEAEELARDLLDFEVRVTDADNDRPGAFRVGSRDELVTALGLAVQTAPARWYIARGVLHGEGDPWSL